jgi:molybdopterin-guanine dinucleotide biosynthesis protein A
MMGAYVELTAFILAGGRSSRMGSNKAVLSLRGRTLLALAQELTHMVTDRVRVCGPQAVFGPDSVEDVYPGHGPLGGIHAALCASKTDFNLILAVDTPFIVPEFLRFLAEEAERTTAVVTTPWVAGRLQPLCAIYRREFAAIAEPALLAGRNKIEPLLAQTTVRWISGHEMEWLAFDARMFDNLNTPEDLERARNRK